MEQVDLLVEQQIVVCEVVPEERKRLGERSASENHFCASVRKRVDGGEALEHPDGVVRGQHRDAGRQPDPLRGRGDTGEHGLRARDRVLGPVVLTESDDVDADLVGQDGFGYGDPDRLGLRDDLTPRVSRPLAETVDAECDARSVHAPFPPLQWRSRASQHPAK